MASPTAGPGGLQWDDVCYSVPVGRRQRKWILAVSGYATPGCVLAVMGPSGSGKTTLLKILAQRMERVRGAQLGGRVHTDPAIAGCVAYVAQDTGFFSCLTVRETLLFTARLHDAAGADAEVDATLHRLGLDECARTLVGGDSGGVHVAGISGGERRRLSIGCEIIGNKKCIIADEPTSGLDSFQAGKTMAILVSLARERRCVVVCSLHAPRSAIFSGIHHLLLLSAGGRVCYHGPAHDAVPYFAQLGHACPAFYNPADFLVDLICVDTAPEDEGQTQARVRALQCAWEQRPAQEGNAPPGRAAATTVDREAESRAVVVRAPGPLRQFLMLAGRAWKQQRRDVYTNVARGAASALIGLAIGTVNFKLGRSQKSIQSRAALLIQMCINTSMMATIKSLNGFSRERRVVAQEMARGSQGALAAPSSTGRPSGGYGVGPYFLAKFLVDTPVDSLFAMLFAAIVGPMAGLNSRSRTALMGTAALQATAASTIGLSVSALTPSAETALAVGPVVMILSLMLADTGGMFAPVPAFLRPLSNLSCIKWGFEGCLVSEFSGLTFDKDVEGMLSDKASAPAAAAAASQPAGVWQRLAGAVEKAARRRGGGAAMEREIAQRMCVGTGEEVVAKLGLEGRTVLSAARAQTGVIAANVLVTYLALRMQTGATAAQQPPLDAALRAPNCGDQEKRRVLIE